MNNVKTTEENAQMQKIDLRYHTLSCRAWTMFDDNAKRISQQRAQKILPMLVKRANQRETISFGELAKKFDIRFALPILFSVVCITDTLFKLERNELPQAKFKWEHGKIPRITNMVTRVNRKPSRWVAEHLEKIEDFQPLLDRIYDYDHWDEVLEVLRLVKLT